MRRPEYRPGRHPSVSLAKSAAGNRRDKRELVAVAQRLLGSDVGFIHGDHRRLHVVTKLGMTIAQTLPDVARARALRDVDHFLASSGDVAKDGEEEQPDFHRRAFYLRRIAPPWNRDSPLR